MYFGMAFICIWQIIYFSVVISCRHTSRLPVFHLEIMSEMRNRDLPWECTGGRKTGIMFIPVDIEVLEEAGFPHCVAQWVVGSRSQITWYVFGTKSVSCFWAFSLEVLRMWSSKWVCNFTSFVTFLDSNTPTGLKSSEVHSTTCWCHPSSLASCGIMHGAGQWDQVWTVQTHPYACCLAQVRPQVKLRTPSKKVVGCFMGTVVLCSVRAEKVTWDTVSSTFGKVVKNQLHLPVWVTEQLSRRVVLFWQNVYANNVIFVTITISNTEFNGSKNIHI